MESITRNTSKKNESAVYAEVAYAVYMYAVCAQREICERFRFRKPSSTVEISTTCVKVGQRVGCGT